MIIVGQALFNETRLFCVHLFDFEPLRINALALSITGKVIGG